MVNTDVQKKKLKRLLKEAFDFPIYNPLAFQDPKVLKRYGFRTQGITDPLLIINIILTFDAYDTEVAGLPCLHLSISESGTYDGVYTKLHYRPKITNNQEIQAWFDLFFKDLFPNYENYVEKEELANGRCTHFRLYFDKPDGMPVPFADNSTIHKELLQ